MKRKIIHSDFLDDLHEMNLGKNRMILGVQTENF